jgi:release factor H-coupled RctB family protein
MDTSLPSHVSLIAEPDVWMESAAVDQLVRTAALPGCVRAVGMPDLHPGGGAPIGAACLFEGRVWPHLIGSDAGCGALLVVGRRDGPRGDGLERRVVHALEEPLLPEVDRERLFDAVWRLGPRGLAQLEGVPEALAEIGQRFEDPGGPSAPMAFDAVGAEQLGSIGGGNHFAEVTRVDRLLDKAAAKREGLRADAQAVLVHTGSRGLGYRLAQRWSGVLTGAAIEEYLQEQRGALRYASANRLLVAWRLLHAAGLGNAARITAVIDRVHNGIEPVGEGYLHRKGAAEAPAGRATLVLGSRGAPSYVVEGGDGEGSLATVAHGAGRRMGRSEAVAKLRARYRRASLERTALGSRVLCDDREQMWQEHPDAYKAIEPVIASLEKAGAARPIATLVPLVTVKQ